MEFYPSDLRYAQDSIACNFRDGRTLDESLRSLLNVDSPERVLPRMDVMHHNGEYYVTDGNRRLYLLKLLESEGLVTDKVTVNLTGFNAIKYTTDNDGTGIRIRRQRNMDQILKGILRNYRNTHRKRNVSPAKKSVTTDNRNTWDSYSRPTIYGINHKVYVTPISPTTRDIHYAASVSPTTSYNQPSSIWHPASTGSQYGQQANHSQLHPSRASSATAASVYSTTSYNQPSSIWHPGSTGSQYGQQANHSQLHSSRASSASSASPVPSVAGSGIQYAQTRNQSSLFAGTKSVRSVSGIQTKQLHPSRPSSADTVIVMPSTTKRSPERPAPTHKSKTGCPCTIL